MEIKDIPQDNSKTYSGHQKVIYGTRNGNYETATSTGWQDEAFATEQAVNELKEQMEQAKQAVQLGEKSAIFYLMYQYRYDEQSLSKVTGLWKWQLKRHFKPIIFAKLSDKTLQKYSDAFQMSIDELREFKI
ncbi:MAG: hypothetical protein KGV46_00590 [Pasteurella sp.]|nr:hypothetical protein [Pasteurella sp.]